MRITKKGKRILSLVLAILLVLSVIPPQITAVDNSDNDTSVIGKVAKITSVFPVLWKDPTNNDPALQVSPTYGTMPELVKIVDVHHYSSTLTLYKLDAYDGAWPEEYADYRWMESTKVTFVEICDKCGKVDCGSSHENWCEICRVDDCTNDHVSATVTDSEGKDQTITVAGDLPEGAGLMVSEVEKPEFDFDYEISVYSYDISLHAGGNKIQPSAPVTLSFQNVKLYDGGVVYVYHVLDDVAAIQAGIENATAGPVESTEFGLTGSAAEAAAEAATGETGVVYVEVFDSSEGTVVLGESSASIVVNSFSTFYLLSGNVNAGSTLTELVNVSDGSPDTIYVVPGTTITFKRTKDTIFDTEMVANAAFWKVSSTSQNVSVVSDGKNVGTSWSSSDLLSNDDAYCRVEIKKAQQPGYSFTLYSSRGSKGNKEVAITIHVVPQNSLINDYIMPSSSYPVMLACLANSTSIPGEPGVADGFNFYFLNSSYQVPSSHTDFASKGQGIISANIATNPNFVTSSDGTTTMGIVDVTGVKTKNAVTGVDWDRALRGIVSSGKSLTASDGTTVTTSNVDYYEMVPYVVKLQTSFSLGWHIDCMVVPRDTATLSYSLNLPGGSAVSDIAVPSGVNKPSPYNVTVAAPSVNGSNLAVGSKVTTTDNRQFTFEGWYTNSSGTGNRVDIGSNLTITENTVLYGKWSGGGYTVGTLIVGKLVETAANSHSPNANDQFTFSINLSGSYSYKIYDTTTYVEVSSSTMSNGTFTLKANQAIYFANVPVGNYTVKETNIPANYTANAGSQVVTVAGGVENTVIFTNTYNKPITHNVTGSIDHGTVTNNNQTVNQGQNSAAMVFTPAEGYEIVKIMVGSTEWPVTDKNSFTYPAQTNVTGAINVVVTTQLKSYAVTGTINNGTVTGGNQNVNHGQNSAVMTFTPDDGYEIATITINGVAQPIGDKKSFTYQAMNVKTSVAVVVTTTAKSYTITWIVDGVEMVVPYKYGETIVKPTDPGKEGHTFTGWNAEIPATMPADNLTFTAQWTTNTYTITWVDGFGNTIDSKTLEYGATVSGIADPTKEGHTFAGWDKAIPATMPAEDIVITAQWSVNSYTVTWIVDSEKTIVTYAYGATIVKPTDPVKNGYAFTGWNGYTAGMTMPAKNLEFTAKFEQALTTLTINVQGCDEVLDPNQSFLFSVTGEDGVNLQVGIVENGSVVIDGLTIGKEYTITIDNDWSWRYESKQDQISAAKDTDGAKTANSIKITLEEGEVVTFTVTRENQWWLDGWWAGLFNKN